MTFIATRTYHLTNGQLCFREGNVPAVAKPPPVSVRLVDGTEPREAVKLLRLLADEIEAAP